MNTLREETITIHGKAVVLRVCAQLRCLEAIFQERFQTKMGLISLWKQLIPITILF